jgi:hypothetical protein
MGQVASSRRRYKSGYLATSKEKTLKRKYPLEVWRQIKDIEIVRLQEKAAETEKEFENMKKKMACQSFLVKEIFEDISKQQREQRENHDKVVAELKKEIAEMKDEMSKMSKMKSSN